MDLKAALDEFRQNLSSEQKNEFESATNQVPPPKASVLLLNEITEKSSTRKRHVLANRMRGVLESVHQYSTIVDTAASVHPIAALVWLPLKIVIQVIIISNNESYSHKFNVVNRLFLISQIILRNCTSQHGEG